MTQSSHWVYDLKFYFLIYKIGKHYKCASPEIFPGGSKGYLSLPGMVNLRNLNFSGGGCLSLPSPPSPLDPCMLHVGLLFAYFGRIYHSLWCVVKHNLSNVHLNGYKSWSYFPFFNGGHIKLDMRIGNIQCPQMH